MKENRTLENRTLAGRVKALEEQLTEQKKIIDLMEESITCMEESITRIEENMHLFEYSNYLQPEQGDDSIY